MNYLCPECLKKLQFSSLLQSHVQQEHPHSVYALFGLKAEDCWSSESLGKLDQAGSKWPILQDTDRMGDWGPAGSKKSKTTQIAVRSRSQSGPDYACKEYLSEEESSAGFSHTSGNSNEKHFLPKAGELASPYPTKNRSPKTWCFPAASPNKRHPARPIRACDACRLRKTKVSFFLPA